jgi:hypothetical protein
MSAAFRNCSNLSLGVAGAADTAGFAGTGADGEGGGGAGAGEVAAWGFGTSGAVAGFSASGAAGFVVSAGICGLSSDLGSSFASSTIAGKVIAPFAACAGNPADWSGGRIKASCDTKATPATGKEVRLRVIKLM